MESGSIFDFFESATNFEMSYSVEISLKFIKIIVFNILMLRGKKKNKPKTNNQKMKQLIKPEKSPLWTDLF